MGDLEGALSTTFQILDAADPPSVTGALYGAVRIGRAAAVAEPRDGVFATAFNGVADTPHHAGPCSVVAGYMLRADGSVVASRREPLFWNPSCEEYCSATVAAQGDIHELITQLVAGDLLMASDDCLVMHDARAGVTYLSSSCAGAALLFVAEIPGWLLFGTSIARFKQSREAPIDVLGLGEVVRFAANFGRRTIVAGIERVPHGHRLRLSDTGQREVRPYIDWSYRPDEGLVESPTRAKIERLLAENLNSGAGEKHLMFSGGVDSCVLAAIGRGGALRSGWFFSMGETDPEERYAVELARRLDLDLQIVRWDITHEQVVDIVRSYATPTLDYSVLPTYLLGQRIATSPRAAIIVEGSGGDSWFGNTSLLHAKTWGRLARLPAAAAHVARTLYALVVTHDASPLVRPLKAIARQSRHGFAGLSYLCASPLYATMLNLTDAEWLAVEDVVIRVYRDLVGDRPQDALGQIATTEVACTITTAAAKTSQWNLTTAIGTLYPFLMPNAVFLGRTVPIRHLYAGGHVKPMLKTMLVERGLPREWIYRKKTGFTPPLLDLFRDTRHREEVRATFEAPHELDEVFTPYCLQLYRRLLPHQGALTFHTLGSLWAVFALKTWVSALRAGRLAVF